MRTHLHEPSENLSHSETSNGRAAGGNRVVWRRGGGQPKADLRSHKDQGRLVPSLAAKSIPVSNTSLFISPSTSGKAASATGNGELPADHASASRFLDRSLHLRYPTALQRKSNPHPRVPHAPLWEKVCLVLIVLMRSVQLISTERDGYRADASFERPRWFSNTA